MKNRIQGLVSACLAGVLLFSGTAHAAPKPATREAALAVTVGPAIREIESPYAPALRCLKINLTAEQRGVSFGIGSYVDSTGKVNYASETASGAFLSQGMETMLLTSLGATGVKISNMSPANRQQTDWIFGRAGLVNSAAAENLAKAGMKPRVLFPDYQVSGALTSLDFIPGGGFDVDIGGLKAGSRKNSVLVGFNGSVTLMPFSRLGDAASVPSTFRYEKQIIGYENDAGITRFFGGGNTRSLVDITFGKSEREPLQRFAAIAMDVVAYRAVRDVMAYQPDGKTQYPWVAHCDDVFRFAETDSPIEPRMVDATAHAAAAP